MQKQIRETHIQQTKCFKVSSKFMCSIYFTSNVFYVVKTNLVHSFAGEKDTLYSKLNKMKNYRHFFSK